MLNTILAHLAPHSCVACSQPGRIICRDCIGVVLQESYYQCIVCSLPLSKSNLCSHHKQPYSGAIIAGQYESTLEQLIVALKIGEKREAVRYMGDILAAKLDLPSNSIVVPIPTIAPHIRKRGFDHCYLLAKRVALAHKLPTRRLLVRRINSIQKGATRAERFKQAQVAFSTKRQLDPDYTYVIIDDVVTTGATVKHAARTLRDAGAEHIIIAALSKVPDYAPDTLTKQSKKATMARIK